MATLYSECAAEVHGGQVHQCFGASRLFPTCASSAQLWQLLLERSERFTLGIARVRTILQFCSEFCKKKEGDGAKVSKNSRNLERDTEPNVVLEKIFRNAP